MSETVMEYSEEQRDKVEKQPLKRELIFEHRHGLDIIVYWLKKSNTILMELVEEDEKRLFIIPNDSVMTAVDHPEVYAYKAGKPRQERNRAE